MGFKPGMPRPANAGRKKGTPDKKSLLVKEILENNGINLVEKILNELPELSSNDRVKALVQMLPYVYPKLVSAELTTNDEGFRIVVEDYVGKK